MYFRKRSKVHNLKIMLHGKTLSPIKKVVKCLGFYLDELQSDEAHCQELMKKLSRGNGMVAKTRHLVPALHLVQARRKVYQGAAAQSVSEANHERSEYKAAGGLGAL